MRIKVPKTIKVASHSYAIMFNPEIADRENCGEVNHRLQEIYIKPGYKPDKQAEILIHELVHCVNDVYCHNQLSEDELDHLVKV